MADPNISITVGITISRIRKRITLIVNRNDTLAIVKSIIAEKVNINLENHLFCLGDCQLSEGDTVKYLLTKSKQFLYKII